MPSSSTASHYLEKRQSPRHRVDFPAWIDLGDGAQARTCRLWDVSDAGARITVDQPNDVPAEFSLIISLDGTLRRRCRVIWRSDEQIGACYVTTPGWDWTS
jgi:hypothetical protein